VSGLNSDADKFDGHVISVKGYLILGSEAHNLRESKLLYEEFARHYELGAARDPEFNPEKYFKFCLTIANPDFLLLHYKEFNEKTVVITGRFDSHYLKPNMIDIGACPLPTAIWINFRDFRRRYRGWLRE
jgi:hypothetical protein